MLFDRCMKLPPKSCEILSLCGQCASYSDSSLPDLSCDSDPTQSREEVAAAGQAYFDSTYGDTASKVQPLLRSIYPDLGMSPYTNFCQSTPELRNCRTLYDKNWVRLCVRLHGSDFGQGDIIRHDFCP